MDSESLIQAFLEAEKNGASLLSKRITLDRVAEICIEEYKKKYSVDMMDSIKLAEEVDELMCALMSIDRWEENSSGWRLSGKWFNLVEELEDVDIMLYIVNKVLNSQLGTENEVYDEVPIDPNRYTTAWYLKTLGLKNQIILKGARKQFNEGTTDEGRRMIQGCLNKICSIIVALQTKYHIKTADINRMRYVKVMRLLNKYGYEA